jgi:hypothetical protein
MAGGWGEVSPDDAREVTLHPVAADARMVAKALTGPARTGRVVCDSSLHVVKMVGASPAGVRVAGSLAGLVVDSLAGGPTPAGNDRATGKGELAGGDTDDADAEAGAEGNGPAGGDGAGLVSVGTGPAGTLTVVAGSLDGATLVSETPLRAIKTGSWRDADGRTASLAAPAVGRLVVAGDCQADVTVTGSLGRARVVGGVVEANWQVGGSVGVVHISGPWQGSRLLAGGDITVAAAGAFRGTDLVAGAAPGFGARHISHTSELQNTTALVGKVVVLGFGGVQDWLFEDSHVSAGRIGRAVLRNVAPGEPGDEPFGFYAEQIGPILGLGLNPFSWPARAMDELATGMNALVVSLL